MKKHLSIVGIVIGLSLILYGRAKQSDIRILGYIILAPSILGALKTYTGLDLGEYSPLLAGVPDSGASRPSRRSRAGQESEPAESMLPGTFFPPQSGARRYGGQPHGGMDVTFDGIIRPPGGNGGGK